MRPAGGRSIPFKTGSPPLRSLAGALLGEIDELVIKRYPVLLGAGIAFSTTTEVCNVSFELVDDRVLRGGTTVATYTRTA